MDPYQDFVLALSKPPQQRIEDLTSMVRQNPAVFHKFLAQGIRIKQGLNHKALQDACLIALAYLKEQALEDSVYLLLDIADPQLLPKVIPFIDSTHVFRSKLLLLLLQQQPSSPALIPAIKGFLNNPDLRLSAALTLVSWEYTDALPVIFENIQQRNSTQKVHIFSLLSRFSNIPVVKDFLYSNVQQKDPDFLRGLAAGAMILAHDLHPELKQIAEAPGCSDWLKWNIERALCHKAQTDDENTVYL